jgi:hypothetical protein
MFLILKIGRFEDGRFEDLKIEKVVRWSGGSVVWFFLNYYTFKPLNLDSEEVMK